ncbi:unnamed protein product [Pelagomonas calceolata]|uniref:Uncharacterized protein n=4 Tax=Pelagomonas calceolata TaxID=35677 RepID=A0A8J2X3K4_9STRA|nr:unnamed protein product [Pelagomonas calceolata]
MAPRRPSSARRTGEILAPTDTTGGAAPVYEADDRTYEHRIGGRAGEVISGTQTQAVGARDLRPGSAPGDVNSNHRLRGLGRHDEFFGTGARPEGHYREEHAPTSFTPRVGRSGEVLNPTRGFAEDATPRTRAAVEARLEEEDAEEEDRGWSLDDALAATDVVVDWAANLWSRVTGAAAAEDEGGDDDDGWDAHEAKLEAARRAAAQKREAEVEVERQREALESATNAAAKAAAELRQTRYDVSSLFGSDSDSDMVLSGASDDDDEEEAPPPPKKRRSLSPEPTLTAVEAIPAPAEETEQPPVPEESVAEPPTHTPVEALPRPAPPTGPPPGLALDDFAASERTAVETPVEPMEPRRSVEGAALALADAESAALEAPAQRSPQRSPARAPRSSVAGAPLALGDVDHAATYSSDDEARPAPTEEPTYADDDAAFGAVMDAFAEAATKAEADRQAAADAEAARAAQAAAAEEQARAARAAADARAAEAAAAAALAAAAEAGEKARAEAKARAAEVAAAAARARAAAEAEAARESELRRAEAERERIAAERRTAAVAAEAEAAAAAANAATPAAEVRSSTALPPSEYAATSEEVPAAQASTATSEEAARSSTALPQSEYAATAPAAQNSAAETARAPVAEVAGAAVGQLAGAAAGAVGGPAGSAVGGAVGGAVGQAVGAVVDAAASEKKPVVVASHRVRRRRGKEVRVSAALQQKRIDELEAKVAEALKLAAAAQKALDEAETRREQAEARAERAAAAVPPPTEMRQRRVDDDHDDNDEEAPLQREERKRKRRKRRPRCGARNWRRCLNCCLCRGGARVSPGGAFEWMLDDAQRNAALRAAKIRAAKLKYLEPPNICDVPFARRLDRSLQARLALLLWIHGLGAAIQLCVGVGAMTIRLGWTPEFGGALGPPFPLPTLALIKAGTCLVVFAILFRKTRIPPCLAALGCAPVPPKPAGGARPQPFRALTSRLLKQFLFAKLLDALAGYLLFWGCVASFNRRRNTRRIVDAFLGLCLTGLTVVDVYGALVCAGTTVYYVYYLYRTPGVDYDTDESGSESSSDSSDGEGHELLRRRGRDARREEALEAFAQATPREIRQAAAVARGGAVPSSLAWADPRFALQTARVSQTERARRPRRPERARPQTSREDGWTPTAPDPRLLELMAKRNADIV